MHGIRKDPRGDDLMTAIFIKHDDEKRRESRVLKDFGRNPEQASKENREQAECISRKTMEFTEEINKRSD